MNLTVKSISYKKRKQLKNIVNWNILVTLLNKSNEIVPVAVSERIKSDINLYKNQRRCVALYYKVKLNNLICKLKYLILVEYWGTFLKQIRIFF